MRTIEWRDGVVLTIDQTRLPHSLVYLKLRNSQGIASAIKTMKIRGAPLIGAAAAYGLALTAYNSKTSAKREFMMEMETRAGARNLVYFTVRPNIFTVPTKEPRPNPSANRPRRSDRGP